MSTHLLFIIEPAFGTKVLKSKKDFFVKMKILPITLILFILACTSAIADSLAQRTMGEQEAQVTIEWYVDFQDPFSEQWLLYTFPQIKEDYINTGKAKLV